MSNGCGVRVGSGHLFFFFAYEAAFEISLDGAGALCEASESPGITGVRPAPAHFQYRPKPLVVPAGPVEAAAGGAPRRWRRR